MWIGWGSSGQGYLPNFPLPDTQFHIWREEGSSPHSKIQTNAPSYTAGANCPSFSRETMVPCTKWENIHPGEKKNHLLLYTGAWWEFISFYMRLSVLLTRGSTCGCDGLPASSRRRVSAGHQGTVSQPFPFPSLHFPAQGKKTLVNIFMRPMKPVGRRVRTGTQRRVNALLFLLLMLSVPVPPCGHPKASPQRGEGSGLPGSTELLLPPAPKHRQVLKWQKMLKEQKLLKEQTLLKSQAAYNIARRTQGKTNPGSPCYGIS